MDKPELVEKFCIRCHGKFTVLKTHDWKNLCGECYSKSRRNLSEYIRGKVNNFTDWKSIT